MARLCRAINNLVSEPLENISNELLRLLRFMMVIAI